MAKPLDPDIYRAAHAALGTKAVAAGLRVAGISVGDCAAAIDTPLQLTLNEVSTVATVAAPTVRSDVNVVQLAKVAAITAHIIFLLVVRPPVTSLMITSDYPAMLAKLCPVRLECGAYSLDLARERTRGSKVIETTGSLYELAIGFCSPHSIGDPSHDPCLLGKS